MVLNSVIPLPAQPPANTKSNTDNYATAMNQENNTAAELPAGETNGSFNVYPAPEANVFTICYNQNCTVVLINIRNEQKESVIIKRYSLPTESFDLSDQEKGIYSIEVLAKVPDIDAGADQFQQRLIREVKKVVVE